jgi:hypothetical protein
LFAEVAGALLKLKKKILKTDLFVQIVIVCMKAAMNALTVAMILDQISIKKKWDCTN